MLSEEPTFYFQLGSDPLFLHFLKILVFGNTHLLFKLVFKKTLSEKLFEYDIFLKALFFKLGSKINFALNSVRVAAGQCL